MENWALKFHLVSGTRARGLKPAEWCLDVALDILRQWHLLSDLAAKLLWVPNIAGANLAEIGTFRFEESWHPFRESWRDFKMRVLKAVKNQLEEYGKEWQPRFSGSDKRSAETHCRWLVHRQIEGRGVQDIVGGRKAGSAASVSEATGLLAAELGLCLRSLPPGRPRKTKKPRRSAPR
jgi:hypothetical protein